MNELTALFYESAAETNTEGWQRSYEKISKMISSGPGTIHIRHKRDDHFDPMANSNDPGFIERFNSLYWHLLPYQQEFLGLKTGEKFLRTSVCPDEKYLGSELYQDHFKKLGIYEVYHYCLFDDERYSAGITFTRSEAKGTFTQKEQDLVEQILPHIQRSARLHLRLLEANHGKRILMEAWNRIPEGVVLVSQKGKVVFQNKPAEKILYTKNGLHLNRNGAIACENSKQTNALRASIRSAFEPIADAALLKTNFQIVRGNGQAPLSVTVSPFKEHDRYSLESEKFAMLLINEPETATRSTEEQLRRTYGLTRSEARLARLIAEGHSIAEVGDSLEITKNTARTHLKRIFGKTRTNRQSSLIKLLIDRTPSA